MEKPFDPKNLETRLKGKGLTEVEGLVEVIVTEVFDWLEESLSSQPNPLYKIGIPLLEAIRPMVMREINKIDGVEG